MHPNSCQAALIVDGPVTFGERVCRLKEKNGQLGLPILRLHGASHTSPIGAAVFRLLMSPESFLVVQGVGQARCGGSEDERKWT